MKKNWKSEKNWIGSYRHKVGPGWGRPGWPGQAAGVRQGRAGPGQARPLGCCPGGWKVKKNWKSEKTGIAVAGGWEVQKVSILGHFHVVGAQK